jgi:hypothetical protein
MILYDKTICAYSDFVREVNRKKLVSSALSTLVHFRESIHRISKESLLSKKLFGRASPGFSLLLCEICQTR